MDLQQILAAILNPGGTQSANRLASASMPSPVGDHNNPALLRQAMAQFQQPAQAPQQPMLPPQAPQAQPMPQNAPQAAPMAAPAPSGGGIGGFLSNLFQGPEARGRNQTIDWLQKQGLDEGTSMLLASNKPALQQYLLKRSQGGANEFNERAAAAQQYGIDPSTPEGRNFILTGNFGEEPKRTSDMQEYELAKSQGFEGSFFDYQVKMKEAGRNQVNIDTGAKLPTGYMWNDPEDQSKGVHPIEGGPATQIPTEAAGRIGLADSFLKNFDTIRSAVAKGDVTGPVDAFQSRNISSSPGAETYRQIQTGVDALQRMLTGAGMPQTEASAYAFRYLPTYTDDAASVVTKLDRLRSELEGVKTRVLQGRGGNQQAQPETSADGPKAPPQVGETRYGYRFKGGDPSEPSSWEKAN